MTAVDSLYLTRLEVVQELAKATSNETECMENKHYGMAEIWRFRAKGLTEQLKDIQESIEREEGK